MTTDITELAQRMKAAAIDAKELAIIARYSKGRAAAEKFCALANPNNILALVEALEKAQQHIAELEEAEQKLCAANVTLDARAELAERQDIAEVKGWNACRAAMLQFGNSPVIPDGYVMVPKEPTDEMIAAAMNCDDVLFNSDESFCVQFGNIYEAMLAAGPQSPGGEPATVPGKWIPVSERMPESNKFVLVSNGVWVGQGLYDDSEHLESDEHWQDEHREFINVLYHPVTHWMPLPAAPQEVKK